MIIKCVVLVIINDKICMFVFKSNVVMGEFDIKVLEANGYVYEYGGIVDAEGNYISAVEINGKTLESESSYDLWNRAKKQEGKYANESSDPILDNIMLYNNDETTKVTSTETKKTLKTTNILTVNNEVKPSFKTEYKYPIVLIASLLIYLIIKKLIKQ